MLADAIRIIIITYYICFSVLFGLHTSLTYSAVSPWSPGAHSFKHIRDIIKSLTPAFTLQKIMY